MDIGSAQAASLDALAFEGATKRNKPNLKVRLEASRSLSALASFADLRPLSFLSPLPSPLFPAPSRLSLLELLAPLAHRSAP